MTARRLGGIQRFQNFESAAPADKVKLRQVYDGDV